VRDRVQNRRQRPIHILINIIVPKTYHPISLALEEFCPPFIICDLIGMLAAIEFDNQLGFGVHKIGNIECAESDLATKLQPVQSASPQP
jgi:hypothetical protein